MFAILREFFSILKKPIFNRTGIIKMLLILGKYYWIFSTTYVSSEITRRSLNHGLMVARTQSTRIRTYFPDERVKRHRGEALNAEIAYLITSKRGNSSVPALSRKAWPAARNYSASNDAPPNCRSSGARSSRSHVIHSPISARKWERAPSAFQEASERRRDQAGRSKDRRVSSLR